MIEKKILRTFVSILGFTHLHHEILLEKTELAFIQVRIIYYNVSPGLYLQLEISVT